MKFTGNLNSGLRPSMALLLVSLSACNLQTSIRKTNVDKTPPSGASTLNWVEMTPQKITGVHASWLVSGSTDLANQKIQFYSGANCNSAFGPLVDLGSNTVSTKAFTAGADGPYTYKVTSLDAKGNASVSVCSSPMVIDTVAPSLAITAAPSWIFNGNKTAYVVSGSCSDATSGIPGNVTVTLDDGAGGVNTGTSVCNAGTFSSTINTTAHAMANGPISVTASVSDAATNTRVTGVTTVHQDIIDPLLAVNGLPSFPTWINIANKAAYPVRGTCSDTGTSLVGNVTITVSDAHAPSNHQTFTLSCASYAAGTTLDLSGGFAPINTLDDGASNITIVVALVDGAGNTATPITLTRSKDVVAPTISGVSATNPGNTEYHESAALTITVNFSENVTVTGTPQLTLAAGIVSPILNYGSGSGTSTLNFPYTVATGDMANSPNLDYAGTNALAYNLGTIVDQAGNPPAALTLAAPGAATSLAANKNISIDTTPTLVFDTSGANPQNPDSFGLSVSTDITHTFTLKNTGKGTTRSAISAVTFTGTNNTMWTVGTNNCSTFTLAPNATCTVDATFNGSTQLEGSYTATITASATGSGTATNVMTATVLCPATTTTPFTFANNAITYKVPGGCTKISSKAWGAGGGNIYGYLNDGGGNPGAGAFVGGTFTVNPGDNLTIKVGGAGSSTSYASTIDGGGEGCSSANGGGFSAVTDHLGNYLILAAGGGGGSMSVTGVGGAGGISLGESGASPTAGCGGVGATSSSGGAGGTDGGSSTCNLSGIPTSIYGNAGSQYQGGLGRHCDMTCGGGGGGGGWYGGGGGCGAGAVSAGGGGGGSSYYAAGVTSVSALAGSGITPGNNGDPDRGTSGVPNTDGKVLITPMATHAYVTDAADVYKCAVSSVNGSLNSCAISDGGAIFNGLIGVAVADLTSGSYAYVADIGAGILYRCSVATVGGNLSGCVATPGSVGGWAPQGVTTKKIAGTTYAFVTDGTGPGIYTCTINQANGAFSGCTNGTAGGENPLSIAVDDATGSILLYATAGATQFKKLTVNGSYVTNGSADVAGYPGGTVFTEGVAIGKVGGITRAYYSTGGTSFHVKMCTVNTGTGVLGACGTSDGGATFSTPQGLGLDALGTYLYATDSSNGVYACSTNSGTGALTTCTLSNGGATFLGPTGIVIH